MMNGHKEALTIATSAQSPDAGRPPVAATDLELPSLFSNQVKKLKKSHSTVKIATT